MERETVDGDLSRKPMEAQVNTTPTLYVKTRAQAAIYLMEMTGQLSDGRWENSKPHDHWKVPCSAMVVVNPAKCGRNFVHMRGYNFGERDLIDLLADRMVRYCQFAIAFPEVDLNLAQDFNHYIDTPVNSSGPSYEKPGRWTQFVINLLELTGCRDLLEFEARMRAVPFTQKDVQREASALTTCFRNPDQTLPSVRRVQPMNPFEGWVEPKKDEVVEALRTAKVPFGTRPTGEVIVAPPPKAWNVQARAFDRVTGEQRGVDRWEKVDVNNRLFADCETLLDVKAAYEGFWNDLGPSQEVVFVQMIKPL